MQIRSLASMNIPSGQGAVGLRFGAAAQMVELGQFYAINTNMPAPRPVLAS